MRRAETPQSPPLAPPLVSVSLTPWGIAFLLTAVMLSIVFACIIASICRMAFGLKHGLFNILPLLDLYGDGTLPEWYSSLLLFLAAGVLGVIGLVKFNAGDAYRWHWVVLAGIFFVLSIDEGISLHERLSFPMRRVVQPDGIYFYAWVIPASIGVLLLGLIYLRFVLNLPARTRKLTILAGCVYIGGALGMEMLEGLYHARTGLNDTPMYVAMVTIEETMEMLGTILFIYALLDYVARSWGGVSLGLKPSPVPAPAEKRREAPVRGVRLITSPR